MKVLKKTGDLLSAMVPFFMFLGVHLLTILVGAVIAIVHQMLETSSVVVEIPEESTLIITIAANAACLIAAIVEMRIHGLSFKEISPVKQNGKVYIFAVFFALGAFFAFKLINYLFLQAAGMSEGDYYQKENEILAVLAILASLTAPFSEELVFRGLLVKNFEKWFSVKFSAVVITILFMLIYANTLKVYLLLLGAALIFIRYKFGDLKLCLLVNLIVSPMSSIIAFVSGEYYRTVMNIGGIVGIFIAAAAMFLMLRSVSEPSAKEA